MMIAHETEGLGGEGVGGSQQQLDARCKRKVELRQRLRQKLMMACNDKIGGVIARECVARDQVAKEN
jgi:hypothetical protein